MIELWSEMDSLVEIQNLDGVILFVVIATKDSSM